MKIEVVGFSRVFQVTNKQTGEVSRKINVSVAMSDPDYAAGQRVEELYLTVNDQFKYNWLQVGQKVALVYNKWGKPSFIELIK